MYAAFSKQDLKKIMVLEISWYKAAQIIMKYIPDFPKYVLFNGFENEAEKNTSNMICWWHGS